MYIGMYLTPICYLTHVQMEFSSANVYTDIHTVNTDVSDINVWVRMSAQMQINESEIFAHGIMIIDIGNLHDEKSSNAEWNCLYFI